MSNLPALHEQIFKNNAKRIIVEAKTTSLESEDCRAAAYSAVGEVFPDWERDRRILFLAIQVKSGVIGFSSTSTSTATTYNYETAHKDKTILPVYVLRKHWENWALIRWPKEDGRLAAELAELHRVTGYAAKTPFLENHNSRVVHENPREFLK
ncbi:uncharacterized protein BDV17DRAFT_299460 [Aspergillus undulatus]|uniref:uncharacterized protein n=1 Tax=Aspergillus undulatus TaxID=1810928 RepID=UPI003CCD9DD5